MTHFLFNTTYQPTGNKKDAIADRDHPESCCRQNLPYQELPGFWCTL